MKRLWLKSSNFEFRELKGNNQQEADGAHVTVTDLDTGATPGNYTHNRVNNTAERFFSSSSN